MKRLFLITILAAVLSVSASFGTGQIEIRATVPLYVQPSNDRAIQMEQQQREAWQQNQWQLEQQRRHLRHQPWQSYAVWLRLHRDDYDNRLRWDNYPENRPQRY